MKERVKENYLKMLKEKLEEEIKSYEIAKKDTIFQIFLLSPSHFL